MLDKIKNQNGFAPLIIIAMLAVVTVGIGYVAITVSNEARKSLREDSLASSNAAASDYFNANAQIVPATTSTSSAPSPSSPVTQTSPKKISGNSNPNATPVLSPKVTVPKTSIDSIRTFFAAIKSGDFVTANGLMGPKLAAGFAKASNTNDPTQALKLCNANSKCNIILNSFQPPADGSYKTKKYVAASGKQGEQISFLLSKSSPTVAALIGDYNVDVFSEEYSGNIWVIQDVYINGKSMSTYF
jgi:hypothetical protein